MKWKTRVRGGEGKISKEVGGGEMVDEEEKERGIEVDKRVDRK